MSLIKKMLKQRALYWEKPSSDGFGGRSVSSEPVEIKCRWEDTQKFFTDPQGNEVLSTAKVYVDRDVQVGGYVVLITGSEPEVISEPWKMGAVEIKQFAKLPNLKVTEYLRTVFV